MTFAERNVFLSRMWKELSEEERNEFNRKGTDKKIFKKSETGGKILTN